MRRLAIFSFAFALAALCAGYLPLDGALIPLGIASAVLAALTALLASLAPAAFAAFRDPVRVMRTA